MIRKESSHGIGYSVVEVGEVRHVFASAIPRCGGSHEEQASDALQTIRSLTDDKGAAGTIIKQDIFIDDTDKIPTCREIINSFYGGDDEVPVTTFIPQSPCAGKHLAIEAFGVGGGESTVCIERHSQNLVVARHGDVAWVHCGYAYPQKTSSQLVYDRSKDVFEQMQADLASVGVRFDQVVRTWLYLGDIVGNDIGDGDIGDGGIGDGGIGDGDIMDGGKQRQRYKELNRARSDFFRPFHFKNRRAVSASHEPVSNGAVYPASTGIGADGRDLIMNCIALDTQRSDVEIVGLENPRQTVASQYASLYSPQSPKFSRAMAIRIGNVDTVLVSGTASIIESESRFIDDVDGQTHQTLDNIAELVSADNFRRHGLSGGGQTLADLAIARVYIKRREDYDRVKRICESRLGELPTVYAVADICRRELLVEIEGMGFSAMR